MSVSNVRTNHIFRIDQFLLLMRASRMIARLSKSIADLIQNKSLSSRRSSRVRRARNSGAESLESRLLLTPGFTFDITTITSDLHPTDRLYGSPDPNDAPSTIIRYGMGTLTSITELPAITDLDSTPGNFTFTFGVFDVDNPVEVLSLSTFNEGNFFDQVNDPARQVFTDDGSNDDPTLTVFHNGIPVATGELVVVDLHITSDGVSNPTVTSQASSPSMFRLTSAVGGDSTVFDAIVAATGGTGEVPFTMSAFGFQGTWIDELDAEIFDSTGATLLSVPEDDHEDSLNLATAWDTSSPIDGNHEDQSDVDWFSANLTAGTQYSFLIETGTIPFPPYVELFDPAESFVMWSDPDPLGDADYAARLTYTPSTTGMHYFKVEGSQVGSYTLSLDSMIAVPTDDHGNDENNGTAWDRAAPVNGNLETGGDKDWFEVQLTEGFEYTFKTNLMTLTDSVLGIYNANGDLLDENDDVNHDNLGSELVFVAPATGTYFLCVGGYEESGDYNDDPLDPYLVQQVGTYSLEQTSEQLAVPDVPVLNPVPGPAADQTPEITWGAANNADDYEVFIANTTDRNTPLVRQFSASTSFTPSTDLGIGTFLVWVRSRAANGQFSAWSTPQVFHINTPVTITPMNLHGNTPDQMISWDALTGAANVRRFGSTT